MEETGLQAKERDLCEVNTQAFRLLRYKENFYWLKFFISHSKSATVTPNEEFATLNWHDIQWEATHTTEEEMKSWNWHLSWLVIEMRSAPSLSWKVQTQTKLTDQQLLPDLGYPLIREAEPSTQAGCDTMPVEHIAGQQLDPHCTVYHTKVLLYKGIIVKGIIHTKVLLNKGIIRN